MRIQQLSPIGLLPLCYFIRPFLYYNFISKTSYKRVMRLDTSNVYRRANKINSFVVMRSKFGNTRDVLFRREKDQMDQLSRDIWIEYRRRSCLPIARDVKPSLEPRPSIFKTRARGFQVAFKSHRV